MSSPRPEGWDKTRALMRELNMCIRSLQIYQGQPQQLRSGVWMDAGGQVGDGRDRCTATEYDEWRIVWEYPDPPGSNLPAVTPSDPAQGPHGAARCT